MVPPPFEELHQQLKGKVEGDVVHQVGTRIDRSIRDVIWGVVSLERLVKAVRRGR